jgi:hypothetical protein
MGGMSGRVSSMTIKSEINKTIIGLYRYKLFNIAAGTNRLVKRQKAKLPFAF